MNENRSNWTFWKTRIIPYLKGSKLWPYIARTIPKPNATDTEKLTKWEEVDAQALSTILMNITPNVQAGLDCSSAKAAWDGVRSKCTALLNRKHGKFGRIRALASAHALRLTTYYHVPEYFR